MNFKKNKYRHISYFNSYLLFIPLQLHGPNSNFSRLSLFHCWYDSEKMENEKREEIFIASMFATQVRFLKLMKVLKRKPVKEPVIFKSLYFSCSVKVEPNPLKCN